MIFGATKDQRNLRTYAWKRRFAWRPIHLVDGRWAWLEFVERGNYYDPTVPVGVPFNFATGAVFRAVQ